MEATVAERGQITLPKEARDKLGLSPGTKLEVEIKNGQLLLRKKVSLQMSKWVGKFSTNGQSTDELMEQLRGRSFPWTGSPEDKRSANLPHDDAIKLLKARRQKK
ncbi:MAG TPA: AbrB family transcriptional regulator [Betaproteobacteria bacterium]|jgi:antitoxin PrlF|nr:AbrB family transcriptional regulator [Betaproteobacteria bacterium]